MSTFMPKANEVSRKWYVLDAAGKPLGRVAAKAAHILRGKHKPTYAPHVDCGDHVIIINCEKAVLTGKKLENKNYYWHTGWIGGLKSISYKEMMEKNPQRAMTLAVNGKLKCTNQKLNITTVRAEGSILLPESEFIQDQEISQLTEETLMNISALKLLS